MASKLLKNRGYQASLWYSIHQWQRSEYNVCTIQQLESVERGTTYHALRNGSYHFFIIRNFLDDIQKTIKRYPTPNVNNYCHIDMQSQFHQQSSGNLQIMSAKCVNIITINLLAIVFADTVVTNIYQSNHADSKSKDSIWIRIAFDVMGRYHVSHIFIDATSIKKILNDYEWLARRDTPPNCSVKDSFHNWIAFLDLNRFE